MQAENERHRLTGEVLRVVRDAVGGKVMARKKEMTTVYLEPEQLQALREIRDREGTPLAVSIRRALDEHLKRRPGAVVELEAALALPTRPKSRRAG